MLDHMQLMVVSPGLAAEPFGDGPIRRLASLAEAVEVSLGRAGRDGRVSVLTHGGYTYPVPSEGSYVGGL